MSADPELLARYPVLASLPPGLRAMLEALTPVNVAGRVLFEDGQECQGFPMIVSGMVRVAKAAPNGREVALYRVAPDVRLALLPPALFDLRRRCGT